MIVTRLISSCWSVAVQGLLVCIRSINELRDYWEGQWKK